MGVTPISQQNQVTAASASVNELCCKWLAHLRRAVDGSNPLESLLGRIHCGSQGIVDALLPARTVRLKMREDIAVDLQ